LLNFFEPDENYFESEVTDAKNRWLHHFKGNNWFY